MVDHGTHDEAPRQWRRPRWLRVLTVAVVALIIARLLGLVEIPTVWFASAIAIEVTVAVLETAFFLTVLRHFYVRHRQAGATRWNAYSRACSDELYAAGAPRYLSARVERLADAQARLWGAVRARARGWRRGRATS